MNRNFARALAVTLQYEGAWSDNPKDPGGATMKGVTLATFRRRVPNASKADLRAISNENLAIIYREDFWSAVKGDTLGDGVDLATFDAGVNSGPGRANNWLKASLSGSNVETVKRICAKRLGFMQSLKMIWKTFGGGWSRRVAAIEAKGVAWAVAATSPAPVVKSTLQNEQKAAKAKSNASATTAGGAATAGGGDVVVNPHHVSSLPGWAIGLLLLAGAAVIAALIIRSIVNKHRADAYAAEAQGVAS